jgi:hypothetical protein
MMPTDIRSNTCQTDWSISKAEIIIGTCGSLCLMAFWSLLISTVLISPGFAVFFATKGQLDLEETISIILLASACILFSQICRLIGKGLINRKRYMVFIASVIINALSIAYLMIPNMLKDSSEFPITVVPGLVFIIFGILLMAVWAMPSVWRKGT